MKTPLRSLVLTVAALTSLAVPAFAQEAEHSVARQWNEELLEAIRNDLARPTVHARSFVPSLRRSRTVGRGSR